MKAVDRWVWDRKLDRVKTILKTEELSSVKTTRLADVIPEPPPAEGHLDQVEYAMEAIGHAEICLG